MNSEAEQNSVEATRDYGTIRFLCRFDTGLF